MFKILMNDVSIDLRAAFIILCFVCVGICWKSWEVRRCALELARWEINYVDSLLVDFENH